MVKPVIPLKNQIAIRRLLRLPEHASEESVQAAIEVKKSRINKCREGLDKAERELASLKFIEEGLGRRKRLLLGMSPDATQTEYFEQLRKVFGTDKPIQEVDNTFNRVLMGQVGVGQPEKTPTKIGGFFKTYLTKLVDWGKKL